MLFDPSVRERISRKLALSRAHGVILGGLASCAAVGPDYSRPEIEVPAAWQRAGDSGVAAPGTKDLSRWWVRLQDPVLASLGGLIGIALAMGASIVLARAMQVSYRFDPTINLLAFLFSAAIGVIFGYFPARRAARLDPIEALRHE